MVAFGAVGYILRIQSILSSLPPGEQRVAMCVLAHPRKVVQATITDLARACDTSEATVVRFCKSLGLDGYKDFRIAIAQELGAVVPELARESSEECEEIKTLASNVLGNHIKAIEATLNSLDLQAVDKAIELLSNARRVEFYGAGPSNVVAMDAYIKFLRIGLAGGFNANAHLQSISASLLGEGDVAVGISYSGTTRDTVDALAIARGAGASTIAITNFRDMPISEVSDVVIYISADEILFEGGTMASRTAQMAVIDLLFAGTVKKRAKEFSRNLEKTRQALLTKLRGGAGGPVLLEHVPAPSHGRENRK